MDNLYDAYLPLTVCDVGGMGNLEANNKCEKNRHGIYHL